MIRLWRTSKGVTLRSHARPDTFSTAIPSPAPIVKRLVGDLPQQTEWTRRLPSGEVARALDESTLLVLPSRSEGLPRVVIEAFCRGRPVIGARAGGIPDIVEDGVSGMLVPREDPAALAATLVRVLSDRDLQERLAGGARAGAERWLQTPQQYADRVLDLVTRVAEAR